MGTIASLLHLLIVRTLPTPSAPPNDEDNTVVIQRTLGALGEAFGL
jgi:hypothetical protein